MLQRQLSEIKNFQKPLHELTLTELFTTSGCGETKPPPQAWHLANSKDKQTNAMTTLAMVELQLANIYLRHMNPRFLLSWFGF